MYITPTVSFTQRYGYHSKTLSRWADDGKIKSIKSPGGHRRYLVESLEKVVAAIDDQPGILYARVSTASQKDDESLLKLIILVKTIQTVNVKREYGSGLNFKRKKFMALMEQVLKQEVNTKVVAHKDRLCRFGFDFVEWFYFVTRTGVTLLFLTTPTNHPTPILMEDFMSIMHCFSSKLYFQEKYEKVIKVEAESDKIDKTVLD